MKIFDLDHAATTPIHPLVLDAMWPFLKLSYGNPSSIHELGMTAKRAIEQSRKQIASILNCEPNELIFTGSGTEATNLAIKGYASKHPNKKEIITTKIEHAATLRTVQYLEKQGYKVHYLKVDHEGFIDLVELRSLTNPNTLVVSIIWGNNEIGTIQDLESIEKIVHEQGSILHVDAVQMLAHIPINLKALNVDMMILSGHKIEGPKGIGLLYKKSTIELEPIIHGGGQETHLRAGTESVIGIVGFEKALEVLSLKYDQKHKHLSELSKAFIHQLKEKMPFQLLGPEIGPNRIPGLLSLSIPDVVGLKIQFKLNQKHIYVSTGSACHTHEVGVSHVIEAIQAPYKEGIVRVSFGMDTVIEDIPYLVEQFYEAYDQLI